MIMQTKVKTGGVAASKLGAADTRYCRTKLPKPYAKVTIFIQKRTGFLSWYRFGCKNFNSVLMAGQNSKVGR